MAVEDPQMPVEVMSPSMHSEQAAGESSSSQKEPTEEEEAVILTAEMLFTLHGLDVTLPVSCDFCPEQFDDMDLFDSHMVTHKESRFFSCQLCNNTYFSWGNLVAHRKACHHGEVLNCDACGKRRFHPDLGPVNFPVEDSPIGCEECGEGFTTIMQLYRHHRTHGAHQVLEHIKDTCELKRVKHKISKRRTASETNLVILPSGEKRYRCDRCPKTFTAKKGLNQHLYRHPVKEDYSCECGQAFEEWDDMCTHVQTDHVGSNLTCIICKNSSSAGAEFLKHYRKCHIARENEMSTMRYSNVTCPVCHKVFSQPSAMHRHQKLHNPLNRRHVCEICEKVLTRRSEILEHAHQHYGDKLPERYTKLEEIIAKEKKYRESVIRKSFICEYCGREFGKKLNLQLHVRRHTGDRPYTCELCGKSFYTNQHLAIHIRQHTGERPYTCGICPKAFTGPTALYVHRKLHDKVKRYICPHCDRRFFWKSAFKGHLHIHTGERPYKCNICSKGFTLKGKLNLHLKKHLPDHAILACSDCGENFSSEIELNAHREEQCCMTMFTFMEERPSGERETRIIVMNSDELEENNVYIDSSEIVHLVVE